MDEKNLEAIITDIDEVIGKDTKDLLVVLIRQISDDNKKLENALYSLIEQIRTTDKSNEKQLTLLKAKIEQIKLELPPQLKVLVDNPTIVPKEVFIKNLKDLPQPPEYPKTINVAKPSWFEEMIAALITFIVNPLKEVIKKQVKNVELVGPRDPRKAIAVQLSNGEKFYDAIFSLASNTGKAVFKKLNGVHDDALIDDDRHLQVDVVGFSPTITTSESIPTTFSSAQQNVTMAGTRVQLSTNTCVAVTVKAKSTNTGLIYVGDVSVTSSNGFILSAGESVSFAITNTNKVYIDSSINGEGISYSYVAT